MEDGRATTGADDLAQAIFENIGRSGFVADGCFRVLDGTRVLIPGGALKDAFAGSHYYFDVLEENDAEDLAVRVSTGNRALTREAMIDGARCFEKVHCDTIDGAFSLYSYVRASVDDAGTMLDDIVVACLNLDGAVAAAMAYDAEDNPVFGEKEFDSGRLFESFGFGETASLAARDFDKEYDHPYDRVLAVYALPYNLQKIAESGVLDAVISECSGGFALYNLAWRRWLFCSEIVGALQARGFSNEQIAYVICHDEDLFHAPEARRDAEALCARIRESSFDPEDIERWSEYLATETGPLAGFL